MSFIPKWILEWQGRRFKVNNFQYKEHMKMFSFTGYEEGFATNVLRYFYITGDFILYEIEPTVYNDDD